LYSSARSKRFVCRGDEITRLRTRARGAPGCRYAKSRTNSLSLWLMSTKFEYAPWAVTSSRSIWSCGAASPAAGFGWSDMGEVYTKVVLGRVIAIDLGAKRIGVAATDELGLAAHPHATIERRGGQRDLDAIAAVVRELGAERVVLGLPLSPEGEVGRAAKSAQTFAERLRAALSVPVELVDESFSTVEAEDVLLEADVSRARRREVIDKLAAAVILRRWLDARPAGGRP